MAESDTSPTPTPPPTPPLLLISDTEDEMQDAQHVPSSSEASQPLSEYSNASSSVSVLTPASQSCPQVEEENLSQDVTGMSALQKSTFLKACQVENEIKVLKKFTSKTTDHYFLTKFNNVCDHLHSLFENYVGYFEEDALKNIEGDSSSDSSESFVFGK